MFEQLRSPGYDIIGDIHGHASKLEALLSKMGYSDNGRSWQHPTRQAIFVGDFIDRGPEQHKTLQIVSAMLDHGSALAVMGNHELNALAYHTEHPDRPNTWLRPRSEKNNSQHQAFLKEYLDAESSADLSWALDFCKRLPLWLDLGDLRVIHAAWHSPSLECVADRLREEGLIDDDFIADSHREQSALNSAVETLLKGVECPLPEGLTFIDHAGHERSNVRCWFFRETGNTYRDVIAQPENYDEEILNAPLEHPLSIGYEVKEPPVFVGHYWLPDVSEKPPEILSPNVACLDFSAAGPGPLVAYRWSGERELTNEHFIY